MHQGTAQVVGVIGGSAAGLGADIGASLVPECTELQQRIGQCTQVVGEFGQWAQANSHTVGVVLVLVLGGVGYLIGKAIDSS